MDIIPIEHKNIAELSTFRMGGSVRYYIPIRNTLDLKQAISFAKDANLPFIIVGGGSNTIFGFTQELDVVLLHIQILGFEIVEKNTDSVLVKIGAGENWDNIVAKAVEMNLSGIEAMSKIPGTAGATPVQNVGAYGQEIKDTLVSVEVYDISTGEIKNLSNTECGFTYRDSIFKHEAKEKYIITSIVLKLSTQEPKVPDYPGVKLYFEKKGISAPTLADIREAISQIRASKLPDPKDIASVGSFFKNPIVSNKLASQIKEKYSNAVIFPLTSTESKIGAGWLIDTLGLKGKEFGNLMLYSNNALVIVNKGGATYPELIELVSSIQKQIKDTFGIDIEPEPIIVK